MITKNVSELNKYNVIIPVKESAAVLKTKFLRCSMTDKQVHSEVKKQIAKQY